MRDSIVEECSQVATCLICFALRATPAHGTAAYWEEERMLRVSIMILRTSNFCSGS